MKRFQKLEGRKKYFFVFKQPYVVIKKKIESTTVLFKEMHISKEHNKSRSNSIGGIKSVIIDVSHRNATNGKIWVV